MNIPKHRSLRTIKQKLMKMKNYKPRLSFYLVIVFILLFVIIALNDILCVDGSDNHALVKANTSKHEPDSDYDTNEWQTAPPLGIPLYRRNLRLYSSTLESKVGSTKDKFKDKLLERQEEMQQLMRNISASMSKNPLVQQIQASRAQFRYKNVPSLNIDTTLQQHRGHDATWQPVNGTHHKFFVYSAFYDDREKPLLRVIATTKTKKSEKVRNSQISVLLQSSI
jgi:hypothetical protein